MKIKVYFNNGNAVVLEANKTVLLMMPETENSIIKLLNKGYTVINWSEVSWVRKYEEAED